MTDLLPGFWRENGLTLRKSPEESVPFAVFANETPSPRLAKQINSRGYGLQLTGPFDQTAGDQLLALFPTLEHLNVTGLDLNLRWVEALESLRTLVVNATLVHPIDLSRLPNLTRYGGVRVGIESVLNNITVTHVEMYDVGMSKHPLTIPHQLRQLRLTDLGATRRLEHDTGPAQLELLGLTGSRHFDLECLGEFATLKVLELDQVVYPVGLESLASLIALEDLHLDSCRISDPRPLLRLTTTTIHVWGRGKFAKELRVLSVGKPNWVFH